MRKAIAAIAAVLCLTLGNAAAHESLEKKVETEIIRYGSLIRGYVGTATAQAGIADAQADIAALAAELAKHHPDPAKLAELAQIHAWKAHSAARLAHYAVKDAESTNAAIAEIIEEVGRINISELAASALNLVKETLLTAHIVKTNASAAADRADAAAAINEAGAYFEAEATE